MNEQITTGNLLRLNKLLMGRIASIVGLENVFDLAVDVDHIKCEWVIQDEMLTIYDNDGDTYKYEICSQGALGEKFFIGTEGDLMFVMVKEEGNFFIIVLAKALG